MNGYKIEKGFAVPPLKNTCVLTLKKMDVGDSFLAPISEKSAVRNAIARFIKSEGNNKMFATRLGPDGIRVFRTA